MTANRDSQDEGDLGHTHYDAQERAEAETNLDQPDSTADEPWSPPDRMPRGAELVGVETEGGETLDQRIRQEQPERGTAYGAPYDREERDAERTVGGDDPDAIPADQDVLGGPVEEVDGESAEQAAMHVGEGDLL